MSSDILKILRSLKGRSGHRNHYDQNTHYGNHHESYSAYGHHYESHGKHHFVSLACKIARELSGKIFQNRRLALLALIVLLTVVAVFLIIGVWLVVTLVNLCGPLISDIEKNGLKGVVDTALKIITRIWEGSGK
jgi:hypothetical protein